MDTANKPSATLIDNYLLSIAQGVCLPLVPLCRALQPYLYPIHLNSAPESGKGGNITFPFMSLMATTFQQAFEKRGIRSPDEMSIVQRRIVSHLWDILKTLVVRMHVDILKAPLKAS